MGCSCDWDRQRFTMDEVCARAVRHTFFAMFATGLIYRGNRLVNWDCALQTAVADDELYKETVQGQFWHLRYPVVDPPPGEPTHVIVATTRPETMLGDTAVACTAIRRAALREAIDKAREKLAAAGRRRKQRQHELDRAGGARVATLLPVLVQIAAMAKAGRTLLPAAHQPPDPAAARRLGGARARHPAA
jgi:valyl-tRNA synthetase